MNSSPRKNSKHWLTRATVARWLPVILLITGINCGGPLPSDEAEPTEVDSTRASLAGATPTRERGAIELRAKDGSVCSAVLINNSNALTSARCIQKFLPPNQRKSPPSTQFEAYAFVQGDGDDDSFKRQCVNGPPPENGNPDGSCTGTVKPKIFSVFSENPGTSSDAGNDLALLTSITYAFFGATDEDYMDIYMGDIPAIADPTGKTILSTIGFGAPRGMHDLPNFAELRLTGSTPDRLELTPVSGRPCRGDEGAPLFVRLDQKAVVGLHSYNTSVDSNGCAKANTTTRAVRLRDKIGWIESMIGKCRDIVTSSGALVKRCYSAQGGGDGPSCDGSPASAQQDAAVWNGCAGSGCWVCTDSIVKDYPRYFRNHPTCVANPTCGGSFATCSVNCPKPTDGDKAKWNTGLAGEYYDFKVSDPVIQLQLLELIQSQTELQSSVVDAPAWRTDGVINFNWGTGAPLPGGVTDYFAIRWTGWAQAPSTGQYVFQTESDDGVRLWVNDTLVIDNWPGHGPTLNNSPAITLQSGTANKIKLEYYEASFGAVIRLRWKVPGSSSFVSIPKSRLSR